MPTITAPISLRSVQARTHLTVTSSRLFSVTSSRTLDALDTTPTRAPATIESVAQTQQRATPHATARSSEPAVAPIAAPDTYAGDDEALAPTAPTSGLVADVAPIATPAASDEVVPVADLADRLVQEASSLVQTADAPTPRGPIKELKFQLDPAELGAVSVKLRMATGRLSVDIAVSNPSALVELEKQRDAMTSKLETSSQSLDSLVIHQQAGSEFHDNTTASAQGSFSSPSSDAPGDGGSRRNTRESAQRPTRAPPTSAARAEPNSSRDALVV